MGPPSRELTEAFCRVPLMWFSQAPWYTLPVHLCRFRVRTICWSYFLDVLHGPYQSDKKEPLTATVTTNRLRNINRIAIDYAFRPRLRDRLTLRRLALRRNPWTFGEGASHTLSVTHVSILTSDTSRGGRPSSFAGLRNAPLPLAQVQTHSFGARLEPRYIVRAGTLV